ncbi:hypothetical protein C8J56DRAFT_938484 [Mycena floridula]|nr:hypothetical protein C8J56DRAFT_938484 [Mycena floridula]
MASITFARTAIVCGIMLSLLGSISTSSSLCFSSPALSQNNSQSFPMIKSKGKNSLTFISRLSISPFSIPKSHCAARQWRWFSCTRVSIIASNRELLEMVTSTYAANLFSSRSGS